eukprot:7199037-Prymnesium_polylepis.2
MGRRLAPLLMDFEAQDPDNSASGLDAGDSLLVRFDVPTDTAVAPPQQWASVGSRVGDGQLTGGKSFVDQLFRFCALSCETGGQAVVGDDYTGEWIDKSTFAVTLLTPGASTLSLGST